MKIKYKYIAFEGTPLTGKTTHAKNLCRFLQELGYDVSYYKFAPSLSNFGHLLLFLRNYNLPKLVIDHLYVADSIMNDIRIRRDLKRGKIVICDKYLPSLNSFFKTFREGVGHQILIGEIEVLEKFILEPDILFYLFCDFKEKLYRMRKKDDISYYDLSLLSDRRILEKLESNLEESLNRYRNIIKINTTKSIEEVDKEILNIVLEEKQGEEQTKTIFSFSASAHEEKQFIGRNSSKYYHLFKEMENLLEREGPDIGYGKEKEFFFTIQVQKKVVVVTFRIK